MDIWISVFNHHYVKEIRRDYFNAVLFLRVSIVDGMEATTPSSPQYLSFRHFPAVNIYVCRVQRTGNSRKPNFLLTCGLSFSVLTVPFSDTKPQSTLIISGLDVTERPPNRGDLIGNLHHYSVKRIANLMAGLFKMKCDVVFCLVGRNHIIYSTKESVWQTY